MTKGFFSKSFGRTVVENEKVMHNVTRTMENLRLEEVQYGDIEGLKPHK